MIYFCVVGVSCAHMHTNSQQVQSRVPCQAATHPPGVVISNRSEHLQESQFVDKIANWRQVFLLLSQAYCKSNSQPTSPALQSCEATELGYEFNGSWLE